MDGKGEWPATTSMAYKSSVEHVSSPPNLGISDKLSIPLDVWFLITDLLDAPALICLSKENSFAATIRFQSSNMIQICRLVEASIECLIQVFCGVDI